ncbi:MAG: hypothetical protein COX07_07685 [Bacteroidetes bacterium CG23_combo_of_CG06-09_8_20_14_all_32_9]|nr:MAG: hypothetical protein COX07_07685 [Bacteroidetes bacterium CG23_combo_of_CG06-09_8_20_14_all_32_9]
MQKNKYIQTKKDKEDDILLIKEFTNSFEDKFKNSLHLSVFNWGELDGIEDYKYCVPIDDLYGAETVYAIYSENIAEMIWLQTSINPNGVNENLIARTFDIKYQKRIKGEVVERFYDYSIDSDEVIKKFEGFLQKKK